MKQELIEWLQDWKLLTFGFAASFADGLIIAQSWDWITSGHRLSIWLLL